MGLLEKFKNAFFEEEYVEVEEKPKVVKKETVIPKQKEKIVNEEPVIDFKKEMEEMQKVAHSACLEDENEKKEAEFVKEDVPQKKEVKFNYFDDDDFLDIDDNYMENLPKKNYERKEERNKPYGNTNYSNQNYSSNNYSTKTSEKNYSASKEKITFKPTPIISPIYGILDKNYTKEDVIDKKEIKPTSSYVSRKNADLDSVRQKAFGAMDADLGLTGDDKIKEEEQESFEEDNLLYDMTNIDKTPSVDKVTLQDAEEYYRDLGLEYNIDYKDAKLERKTGRRVAKTPALDEIEEDLKNDGAEDKIDDIESKDIDLDIDNDNVDKEISYDDSEDINNDENEEITDDNLFDLIDSMYDEKE